MTDDEIARARAIIAAATDGPWETTGAAGQTVLSRGMVIADSQPHNARLIAAARTGWPAALDEIERSQARLEAWREAALRYEHLHTNPHSVVKESRAEQALAHARKLDEEAGT